MTSATHINGHRSSTIPPPGLSELAAARWGVKHPPADPEITFAGKIILVTGANAGLGFEAAVKYAQKGASKLMLAVRSAAKGETAKQEILRRSGKEDEDFITVLTVDLSSFDSVHSFIKTLEAKLRGRGLHIALLNAGLANPTFIKNTNGYEEALQVNVLSTALMAILLLPLLRQTSKKGEDKPHLTFVNSNAHREPQSSWYSAAPHNGSLLAFTNDASYFDPRKHYGAVKLLGMSIMLHIARTNPDVIIVNACCPFLCKTELGRNFTLPFRMIMGVMQYFTARTAEEGARTLVGATVLDEESQGAFWTHDVLAPMGELARSEEEMERCWGDIKEILERTRSVADVEGLVKAW
jgi:NAD(P)-dependent dehydrogenase (short-subunit alcohol dehydrogenase family)